MKDYAERRYIARKWERVVAEIFGVGHENAAGHNPYRLVARC